MIFQVLLREGHGALGRNVFWSSQEGRTRRASFCRVIPGPDGRNCNVRIHFFILPHIYIFRCLLPRLRLGEKKMFTTRLPRLLGGRGYPIRDPTHLAPSPRVQWVLGCHGPGRLGTVPRGWPAQVARTPLVTNAETVLSHTIAPDSEKWIGC